MNPISVGLIGFGLAGSVFHAPFIAALPRFRLACAVTSRVQAVLEAYPSTRVYADPSQALGDPTVDMVVIATPNETHFDLARTALLAGKHVVVDKPFAHTASEALELDRLARERGLVAAAYHNRRWDGDFLTVKACIDEGWIGPIHHLESSMAAWRTDYALDGPHALHDKGPHLIDQALCLFGMPQTVFAETRIERSAASVPDFFHVVLHYSCLRVVLNASLATHWPISRFVLHGSQGSFVKRGTDGQGAAIRAGRRPAGNAWYEENPGSHGELVDDKGERHRVVTRPGDYRLFYEAMADAILHGGPTPVTATEAASVARVIEACMDSAASGRTVSLQP